jgi:hypothetical protein
LIAFSIKGGFMSDEKRRILNLLAEGKINVTEAEGLLNALGERGDKATEENSAKEMGRRPSCLRILVEDCGSGKEGDKVNVKIPLQLIRAGMKLGSILPGKTREKIDAALKERGFTTNLSDMKAEQLEEVFCAMKDCCIDVDSADGKVKICCE